MPVLSVRGLSIDYITRKGPVHAVRDVSFDLEKSETLAIIGESGSGKTTLAVGLIRLSPRGTKVTSGEILYTKKGLTTDVRTLDDDDLREYRWAEAAMVFQAALNSFNPVISIW
ncbi:MAG: ATP-binding cassette domain-containing protein, partial [Chloroflexi bacterium]